jgi:hypothetical protein
LQVREFFSFAVRPTSFSLSTIKARVPDESVGQNLFGLGVPANHDLHNPHRRDLHPRATRCHPIQSDAQGKLPRASRARKPAKMTIVATMRKITITAYDPLRDR